MITLVNTLSAADGQDEGDRGRTQFIRASLARPFSSARSILTYWHLLSLDAPTVAAVWACFIARNTGVRLPASLPAAMFLAVWIIYASDRLLDARLQPRGLGPAHRFHADHRVAFVSVIVAATFLLVSLLPNLRASALRLDTVLTFGLIGWLLPVHGSRRFAPSPFLKSVATGLFFTAAVFLPTLVRVSGRRLQLVPVALLLVVVSTLNSLFPRLWVQGPPRSTPAWLRASCILAGAASFSLRTPISLALGVAAASLFVLDRLQRRVPATELRAAADLALLTPLLIWPLL